jgi:hypothetical protein
MWVLRLWHALTLLLAIKTLVRKAFFIESKPKGKLKNKRCKYQWM